MTPEKSSFPVRLRRENNLAKALGLAVLTLAWSAAVTFNLSPYLRGPGEYPPDWRWWLAPKFDLVPARLIPLAFVVGAGVLWWRWTRRTDRLHLGHLLVLSALGFALVLAIQNLTRAGIPLMTRLISPEYSGYFPAATEIRDLRAFLLTYPDEMHHLGARLRTHPPGNTVFFWFFLYGAQALPAGLVAALGAFLRAHTIAEWAAPYTDAQLMAAAVAAVTVVAIAAVTVIPLYYLGLETVGHPRARYAVLLYLLVPAVPLFAPVVDLTFTFLAATSLWTGFLGLTRRSYPLIAVSGLVLSIGAFMTHANLTIAFMVALLALMLAWRAPVAERAAALLRLIPQGLTAVAGGSLVWLVFLSNPILLFIKNTAEHAGLRVTRNYWTWLFYNPYDLFLFAGLPLALLLLLAWLRLARRAWRRETLSSGEMLFAGVTIATVAMFVNGTIRGEAGRILLYYFPIMALMSQVNGEEWQAGEFAIVAGAMLVQTIIFYLGLWVYH